MASLRSLVQCTAILLASFVGSSLVRAEGASAQPSGTFARGPDYEFSIDTKSKVKRTAVEQQHAYGATVAPDGLTYVIDSPKNGKDGAQLIGKKNRAFFPTPEVHDVQFSPDSRYVSVLDDETLKVTVLSVPDGKVVKQFSRAYMARFRSDTIFQYRTDCQIYEADLTTTAEARQVGPKLCGGADASTDGRVWVVTQPSSHGRVLSLRDFSTLTQIDGISGSTAVVPTGSSFHDPSVTPAGKRICFGNSGRLSCYDLTTKTVDKLGTIDAARLDWEKSDELMLGATRDGIFTVDFTERSMRKVSGLDGIRYWRFFPGGSRVYVYDKGARVLDLDTKSSIEIYPKKTEVGGFVPVPGRIDRFMTGNEVGPSRVHYWIDVTPPSSKPDAKGKQPATSAVKTPNTSSATTTGVTTQAAASSAGANAKTKGTSSASAVGVNTRAASSATAASTKSH